MSGKNELDLLVELVKLVRKYGPETFESLAAQISMPEFTQRLADLLSTTAKASRAARPSEGHFESRRPRRNFRSSLLELEKSEPEKAAILIRLYDGLMAKTFLPTLRELKAFASDNGLPPPKATARDKAIVPLIKTLLPMSLEELKTRLQGLQPILDNDDRSLEGWSNIILSRERQSKQTD